MFSRLLAIGAMLVTLLPTDLSAAAKEKPVVRPPLNLHLPGSALKAAALPHPTPRSYAVTLRDDPWRAFSEDIPLLAGTGIPQLGLTERESATGGPLSFPGLLDGETIPLLRIRLSPDR